MLQRLALPPLAVGLVALFVTDPVAADWHYWRGPTAAGTSSATGLPDDLDSDGDGVVWSRDDIGGICTPVEMDGRLYTTQRSEPGTDREGERVVCLDAATGETLWEHRSNVWMSDVPAERIGWSSPVADPDSGNVYVLTSCCLFLCLDGENGDVVWSIPLHEQFGMLSTYGGRTNFPIVHEDLVIISGIIINWGDAAKPNHRLIAFDKLTGEVRWFSGTRDFPSDTSYSAPTITTVDGQRQLILGCGDGSVWSFQPRTGRPLWHHDVSMRGLFASPLVVGDRVFIGHSEENVPPNENLMGAIVALKTSGTGADTKVEETWKHLEVVCGYSEPVMVDGRVYLVDDRCKMWVFDADTGEILVRQQKFVGSRQRSALLHADGKIYVTTENGRWAVVRPTDDGFDVIDKGRVRGTGFAASPIVADGRLYLQSTDTLYCVAAGGSSGEDADPDMAEVLGEEPPASADAAIDFVTVSPAETLVKPGETVSYTLRAFNRRGQAVDHDAARVRWSVNGPATIDADDGSAVLTADGSAEHRGAVVTATVDGVSGTARVRIVPPLPWRFTFDGLKDPPETWVGARYRHVVRPIDGDEALVKITTIPKGARSRGFLGPSDLANYTIAADVMGRRMSNQLPDIGLTAMGYALDLMGESQQLQIRTWATQLRIAETVDFPWEPDRVYRMKLSVEIDSEPPAAVAIVRGKVWPADQSEPEAWTVQAEDTVPNLSGSPGLYGNAKVAEIVIDNVTVEPL